MRIVNGRVAGALYLVIIVVGIACELIRSQMLVPGDAAATAENVQESGWLLRAAVSATLAYTLGEVVLTVILYQLFAPVSRPMSMVAAAFRLISLAIYGLNLMNLLAPVLLLGSGQPRTFALLFLNLHQHGLLIGLTFFAMNCLAMGYLLVTSSHVPTLLGVLLGVAGLGYLINSYLYFLVPGYHGSATLPCSRPPWSRRPGSPCFSCARVAASRRGRSRPAGRRA